MAKTFYVQTCALTYYDNLIRVDEKEMQAYKDERPDLTEKEIITEMFADGNCENLDCMATDYQDETVVDVRECNTEEDKNV